MTQCARCGTAFSCAVEEGTTGPCWCMALPPLAALPPADGESTAGCWCPACLAQHIAERQRAASATPEQS